MPPFREIFSNFPSLKNPSDKSSPVKKGDEAFSNPGNKTGSVEFNLRRYMFPLALNTMLFPSCEIASAGYELTSSIKSLLNSMGNLVTIFSEAGLLSISRVTTSAAKRRIENIQGIILERKIFVRSNLRFIISTVIEPDGDVLCEAPDFWMNESELTL